MEGSGRLVRQVLAELQELKEALDGFTTGMAERLVEMARIVSEALEKGNIVLTCGNGGSAADAQHIAGELVGRFRRKKLKGYRAFALTVNSSVVTSLANDFTFEEVFSRQIEAVGSEGDVLIALSTSGDSQNVIEAVRKARSLGMISLALTGGGGGALAGEAQVSVEVPHGDFARVQEMHMALGHILCGMVEEILTSKDPGPGAEGEGQVVP